MLWNWSENGPHCQAETSFYFSAGCRAFKNRATNDASTDHFGLVFINLRWYGVLKSLSIEFFVLTNFEKIHLEITENALGGFRGRARLGRSHNALARSKLPPLRWLEIFRKPRMHFERTFSLDLAVFSLELTFFSLELAGFRSNWTLFRSKWSLGKFPMRTHKPT